MSGICSVTCPQDITLDYFRGRINFNSNIHIRNYISDNDDWGAELYSNDNCGEITVDHVIITGHAEVDRFSKLRSNAKSLTIPLVGSDFLRCYRTYKVTDGQVCESDYLARVTMPQSKMEDNGCINVNLKDKICPEIAIPLGYIWGNIYHFNPFDPVLVLNFQLLKSTKFTKSARSVYSSTQ